MSAGPDTRARDRIGLLVAAAWILPLGLVYELIGLFRISPAREVIARATPDLTFVVLGLVCYGAPLALRNSPSFRVATAPGGSLLFSEFSGRGPLGRLATVVRGSGGTPLRPARTALLFAALGLLTTVLSIVADAAVIVVPVLNVDGTRTCFEFGYLAEASHGPMLLCFAPWIVYFGLRLLHEIDTVLRQMQQVNALACAAEPARVSTTTVDVAAHTPSELIALANRRFFNPLVMLIIACSIFGRAFGNEFYPLEPHVGDRWEVPFGYVQADYVAEYRPGDVIVSNETTVTIVHQPNGPQGRLRVSLFWAFLLVALFTHAVFACVVTWMCLKFVFVGSIVMFAVANATGHGHSWLARACQWLCGGSVVARLDVTDSDKRFGLSALFGSFRFSFWLLLASGLGSALALGTGSSAFQNLQASISATGGVGLVPIVIVVSLYVMFGTLSFYLGRYRDAAAEEAAGRGDGERYARSRQQRVASVTDLLPVSASVLVFSFLLPFFTGEFRSTALTDGHRALKTATEAVSESARTRLLLCDQIAGE